MKKLIQTGLAAVIVSALMPHSAQAISIGILGGDVDPELPSIYSIELVGLATDNCFFVAGVFCAAYEVPNDGDAPAIIDSIDFRLQKLNGDFYLTSEIDLFNVGESSDLPFLAPSTLFPDGFTFTLFDPLVTSIDCLPAGVFCRADFFSDDPSVAAVSIVGVNGVVSSDAAPVPEPASLLLVGAGAVLLARRLRRSAHRH